MSDNMPAALRDETVSLDELAESFRLSAEEAATMATVAQRYPFRLTRHYFRLIREKDDPIWRQAVPDARELQDGEQLADPLDEGGLSPVPGLIHRYPDRVVWLVANSCAVYCRFCMRKRQVGCGSGVSGSYNDALRYIRETPAIRDVILSGGDPLLLDNNRLEALLASLRQIPHIEIIRIGTRLPVTFPQRIDAKLCSVLRRYHPIFLNTHFNHPLELTEASRRACAMLADAGVQLGNQTVLMAGVNDDPAVMAELCRGLLAIRVKPYYLHQMDLVQGTAHFRTPVKTGLRIMEQLRGHISGLGVPYYVIDLPGGKGKVPLLPGQEISPRGELRLRTYLGETVIYQDLLDCNS